MQLEFLWNDELALKQDLESKTGMFVDLTITNNKSTMLTFKRDPESDRIMLRLHRMFLSAPPEVVKALAVWIKSPRRRKAGATIDTFIQGNGHQVRKSPPPPVLIRSCGIHFDLQAMFDDLNEQYFKNSITSSITWGQAPTKSIKRRTKRRSIRFGSFVADRNLIRIHPYLDQDFVPDYFVRYIVFHEMLHAHFGVDETKNGRRRIHPPEFKKIEQKYHDYDRALTWQDDHKNLYKFFR